MTGASRIRRCTSSDLEAMFAIINDAARAYQGVIPEDRWHEPYMPMGELEAEIRNGVEFRGYETDGGLAGVMGAQDRGPVTLIRHAYVRTATRNRGIGTQLLRHLQERTKKPILIGTWIAATWAVRFYRNNGYTVLSRDESDRLLRLYWSIPERQIATSVVLAGAGWRSAGNGAG